MKTHQLDLFSAVKNAYASTDNGTLNNDQLYLDVAAQIGVPISEIRRGSPVGKSGQKTSLYKRKIRWIQQTLKQLGLLEKVEGRRAIWRWTGAGKHKLRQIQPSYTLLGFSTRLGLAVWGDCAAVFSQLDEPIHLCLTSPPYPLSRPRAYGNLKNDQEYIDFVCCALEPIIRRLATGASIALNLGNDIFTKGAPGRSLYRERLLLALCDRFGLVKMDELIWHNPAKPPGPTWWACVNRQQLRTAYEPIYWLTNDPQQVFSDNRRVLEPHTEKMKKLIATGGEKRSMVACDGTHRIQHGDFGRPTPGRIPTNILRYGHTCFDQRRYKQNARELGLPPHSAPYPLALAEFLIKFLSREGDLVVDPFAGSFTTAKASERHHRRWIGTEVILEYIRGSATRFIGDVDFWINPELDRLIQCA